ncbi:MAG TPA: 2-C-methyl-D-erythritol 4-phosphate cytidylyltransferase [Pyrinomonadaceae bacterium]|nr:2-C-methyl-D-erythritol 4-phosphate cytidylyltransferase [Pyrinomonadaceae bacterium]
MNVAIIVAGGKGTRFGGHRPKQFLEINGTSIIVYTLRQFEHAQEIDAVVVAVPAEEVNTFRSAVGESNLKKVSQVVAGGDTRAQSVKCGLASIEAADVVAVHDAVRPLVTPEEIDQVMLAANNSGAAILVAPVSDTIKEVDHNRIVRTVPRAQLRRALTPQCFRFDILKRAYADLEEIESLRIEVTDDSFLVERLGVPIAAVEGSARNIKITNQDDLAFAETVLRSVVSRP